jgi:hypothetical protein
MQVYRAEEAEAARPEQLLNARGVQTRVERYGSSAVYVVVWAEGPEIARLAQTAGKTVREGPVIGSDLELTHSTALILVTYRAAGQQGRRRLSIHRPET